MELIYLSWKENKSSIIIKTYISFMEKHRKPNYKTMKNWLILSSRHTKPVSLEQYGMLHKL
jgi:hypothetical protein